MWFQQLPVLVYGGAVTVVLFILAFVLHDLHRKVIGLGYKCNDLELNKASHEQVIDFILPIAKTQDDLADHEFVHDYVDKMIASVKNHISVIEDTQDDELDNLAECIDWLELPAWKRWLINRLDLEC